MDGLDETLHDERAAALFPSAKNNCGAFDGIIVSIPTIRVEGTVRARTRRSIRRKPTASWLVIRIGLIYETPAMIAP